MPAQSLNTLTQLRRVDANDHAKLIKAIKADGAVIITNFTTPEFVDQVNAETKPYLEADVPWEGKLFSPETRRCTRLVSRSRTCRDNWLLHPAVTFLTDTYLAHTSSHYYSADRFTYTSSPILNISLTLEVNPGGKAQRIHRDDQMHHNIHTDQTGSGYQMGSDTSFGFLIPGVKMTRENGATLVIPGSHLWGAERAPTERECGVAGMEVGEALAFLGGLYHAGGANVTRDQRRPVHLLFFCQGFLRTEENQYLAHSREEVLSWSPEVQAKMGFNVSLPNLGFVDFTHPIDFLSGASSQNKD